MEALRRFQDAPTKLQEAQEAPEGSQVVSGSFMFRMSVVFKGSKVQGSRARMLRDLYSSRGSMCFKISGPFMFHWFAKTQDSEHVSGSCRTAGL